MKEQKRIPITKVQRASKFISTGARIGTNYLKHYSKKLVNPDLDREQLHNDNATDIYDSLSELKGSALKVAQMLSRIFLIRLAIQQVMQLLWVKYTKQPSKGESLR